MYTRNNERGADFQNEQGETTVLVRACDEKERRTHTAESFENGYTRERKRG